jgi:mannosyltransferase
MLFAFTPFIDDYAQNGRSYGLVCLCVALTVLALLRALDAPGRWSRWLGYGGLVTLTGYLHEMTLLLALSFAVTLVIAGTPRLVMARWLATIVIAGALVSPLLLISLRESKAVGYLRPPDWGSVQTLVKVDFGLSGTVAYSLLGCALVAALPLRHTWTGQRAGSVTLAALAIPMLVIPPAVLMVESRVGNPVYDVRYVLYGAMAAAMLAASGLHRIGRGLAAWIRPARWRTAVVAVPAMAACACAVIVQWPIQQYVRTVASRHQDFGGASNYLTHAHTQAGDGVLFMPRSVRSAELGYPAPYQNLDDLALAQTPERAGTFLGVDLSPRAIRIAIERHARIWVVGQYPLRGSAHASPGAARLLRTEYHPTVIGRFTGADVVLYVKGRP